MRLDYPSGSRERGDDLSMAGFFDRVLADFGTTSLLPVKVSTRSFRSAVEEALIHGYTRTDLEAVLNEELRLEWGRSDSEPNNTALTKRDVIRGYTDGWELLRLIGLARRIVQELDLADALLVNLKALLTEYDKGNGVESPVKNLIFAANGPKPDLVLRDSVSNQIEIVRNAEYCLVFEDPIPADGLKYSDLIVWWRKQPHINAEMSDRDVGLDLHRRLRASLGDNQVECRVFDAYAARYKDEGFSIPALIPQVYLHFDPATAAARQSLGQSGSPLARQRMDFLILFSSRHRVVLEVDGKQHYANGEIASPSLYSNMVAEDRRLRLSGYEVYRFGGHELMTDSADGMLAEFFAQLSDRMK